METLFPLYKCVCVCYTTTWRCLKLWYTIVLGANNVEHRNYVINQFQDFNHTELKSNILSGIFIQKPQFDRNSVLPEVSTQDSPTWGPACFRHEFKPVASFWLGWWGLHTFNLGFSYLITRHENSHRFSPLNILLTVF